MSEAVYRSQGSSSCVMCWNKSSLHFSETWKNYNLGFIIWSSSPPEYVDGRVYVGRGTSGIIRLLKSRPSSTFIGVSAGRGGGVTPTHHRNTISSKGQHTQTDNREIRDPKLEAMLPYKYCKTTVREVVCVASGCLVLFTAVSMGF